MSDTKTNSALGLPPEAMLAAIFEENRTTLRHLIASRMDKRLRGRVDPSDILQETLTEAFQRFNDYLLSPKCSLSNWLVALASQQVLVAHRRHIRTKKRSVYREDRIASHPEHTVDVDDVQTDSTDPGMRVANSERTEQLRLAIHELSDRLQTVVRMRFIEEHSIKEIADTLGITEEAASKRAMRGLRRLSEILGKLDR